MRIDCLGPKFKGVCGDFDGRQILCADEAAFARLGDQCGLHALQVGPFFRGEVDRGDVRARCLVAAGGNKDDFRELGGDGGRIRAELIPVGEDHIVALTREVPKGLAELRGLEVLLLGSLCAQVLGDPLDALISRLVSSRRR